jgi:bifunctional non-homologous end joining protein LigD
MDPIIPQWRKEPFDHPEWTFELKYDGFRGLADTVNSRMLPKNGNRLKRFDALVLGLPRGCAFDGEIAVLDRYGRPRFNALLFHRGQPVYVAFDVLYADGQDLRHLPLAARKAILDDLLHGRTDLVVLNGIAGGGVSLFRKVCELDLEGIVAKRLGDPYGSETKWLKVLNRSYSQKHSRGELFAGR